MSRALLITASYDKQIRFWDVSSGRTVRYFIFQDSQVNCMLHIPSVNCLAIGGFGILRIYNLSQHAGHSKKDSDVQSPPPYSSYESQASMNFTSLAYFAVSYVAHAPPSTSQSVLQQNSLNAYPKTSSPNDLKLDAPALQETHERDVIVLCTTSEDGHIRFFDIRSHTSPRVLADISTGVAITCSGISPDRRYLLTGNQMGLLSVWHLSSIMAGAFAESTTSSPAAAGFGEAMKHLATRPLQNIVFNNNYAAIRSIAIEPLARWAAVANNTGHVHFIRLARSREASPTSIKELDKIFSDASKSLTSIATDEPDEIKGASADMQEGVSDLSDVKSSRTDNEKVSHGGEVALSIAASIAERQEKKTGASPNELHDDAFSSEATVDAGRGEDGAEGVGAGDATQTDLSERTYASHRVAEGKYVVLGDIQRALLFEVFHSHHAHCKYILKVLVSPQGDLVVTCSADYTIGRYIVPQQLRVAHINSSCDLPSPVVVNLLSIMRGGLDAGFSLNSNMPIPRGTISCNAHKKSVSNVVKSGDKIADGGAVSVNTLHARAEMSTLNQTEAKSVGDVTTRASDGALLQPESRDRSDSFARNPAHASLSRNNATLAVSKNADEASSRELSLAASGTTETHAALPERGSTNFHALSPLQGHNRWVWDCVFSNCGNYLFSCSSDNSVRMWYNLKSERPQSMCFVGHTKSVISTVMYYE